MGYLYDPIICFTYKDIFYDNGTEIVETYYEFHNLSRVYQEFVDGNYNERIDDNNILYRINKIKSSIEIMLDFFIFYKKLML